jgi:hypothetical protein
MISPVMRDTFELSAGALNGRVSDFGHVWSGPIYASSTVNPSLVGSGFLNFKRSVVDFIDNLDVELNPILALWSNFSITFNEFVHTSVKFKSSGSIGDLRGGMIFWARAAGTDLSDLDGIKCIAGFSGDTLYVEIYRSTAGVLSDGSFVFDTPYVAGTLVTLDYILSGDYLAFSVNGTPKKLTELDSLGDPVGASEYVKDVTTAFVSSLNTTGNRKVVVDPRELTFDIQPYPISYLDEFLIYNELDFESSIDGSTVNFSSVTAGDWDFGDSEAELNAANPSICISWYIYCDFNAWEYRSNESCYYLYI